jgi:hypothetical protein
MNIGWPGAIVLCAILFSAVAIYGTVIAAKANKADRDAKVVYGDYYKELTENYEALVSKAHEEQAAIRADIATLQRQSTEAQAALVADMNRLANSVESIEAMMRDVG